MTLTLQESTLIDSEEKRQQMAHLIVLRMAAAWLEKQDWVSSPYGGQNPVQDFLFQIQLTANRIWDDFFLKKPEDFKYNLAEFKKQIMEMGELAPELKTFFKQA